MYPLKKLSTLIINKISENFSLEKCEIGDFSKFQYPKLLPITKYKVESYHAKGIGSVAVLQSKTLNFMSLLTIVITPDLSRNMPFVIIDCVKLNKKYISFFEFFDGHTNDDEILEKFINNIEKIKGKYANLNNYIEKSKWYVNLRANYSLLKCGNSNKENDIIQMIMECLEELLAYMSEAKKPVDIDDSRKRLKAFVGDLINKGNPSSKPLEKALGHEKANRFFRDVVFFIN